MASITTIQNSFEPATALDLREIISVWLGRFAHAVTTNDADAVSHLFIEEPWWRDLLMLSWDFHTFEGRDAIRRIIAGQYPGFTILSATIAREMEPALANRHPYANVIEALVDFETDRGSGRGVVRLVETGDGGWKAWTLLTTLQDARGYERKIGARRERRLPATDLRPGENFADWRKRRVEYLDRQPDVVIVGAGQGGLALAANLGLIDVDALIVERNGRVGDNWRNRYHSLTLHDTVWTNHLPFVKMPESWPVNTPKDKLADWLESYANAMDLNVWTSSEMLESSYDDAAARWTIKVRRPDGTTRIVTPRHVVLATGVHGEVRIPDVPGLDRFKGELVHSSAHRGGVQKPGRKAVVIGSGNSGHDVAADLQANGADVTLVQRSSTYIMSQEKGVTTLFGTLFREDGPETSVADLLQASFPFKLALKRSVEQTRLIADLDRELLDGLARVGFRLDQGINGGGAMSKVLDGAGGYYFDVGCSQLIIDGKITLAHGSLDHLTEDSVVLDDGTTLPAEIVVLATGYGSMRDTARRLFGDSVADRCSSPWGLDAEGEMNAMWRRSGHPGFWFTGGSLYFVRFYSHFLALQIMANLKGLDEAAAPS